MLNGLSLFANVGIAETYLSEVGINVVVANELLEPRAKFYKHLYPNCNMVVGDITAKAIFEEVNIYYETVTDKIYIYINCNIYNISIILFFSCRLLYFIR